MILPVTLRVIVSILIPSNEGMQRATFAASSPTRLVSILIPSNEGMQPWFMARLTPFLSGPSENRRFLKSQSDLATGGGYSSAR